MTHGSLFSGIGGFDLAAAWAGWENVFACEIDPFCQKVLKYHFPNSTLYENIRTTDFTIWRGRIDVLSGGFPCQPFSTAGKRKGTEDDRYLWPEMLRAIREISPRWVVGENVLGIVNWNGGMVFEQVCADMEAEGYEVQPYVLPACGVGAPHQRQRTWFVAYRADAGPESMQKREDGIHEFRDAADSESVENNRKGQSGLYSEPAGACYEGITSNSDQSGLQKRVEYRREPDKTEDFSGLDNRTERFGDKYDVTNTYDKGSQTVRFSDGVDSEEWEVEGRCALQSPCDIGRTLPTTTWENFPTQSPVCGRDDGIPGELDGITLPSWRKESLKAYGNAVVPLVPLQIFNAINQYEKNSILL